MSKWLNIKDYSATTGISVSSIRRRIKENSIKFKAEEGKYFILLEDEEGAVITKSSDDFIKFAEKTISSINMLNQDLMEEKEKRLAIQEELIKQLKEEVSELRMLVRVLETNQNNS